MSTVTINIILNPAKITVKLLNNSCSFEKMMKYADYEIAQEYMNVTNMKYEIERTLIW